MNKFVTSGIFSLHHGVAGDVKAPQKIYLHTTNQGKEHKITANNIRLQQITLIAVFFD